MFLLVFWLSFPLHNHRRRLSSSSSSSTFIYIGFMSISSFSGLIYTFQSRCSLRRMYSISPFGLLLLYFLFSSSTSDTDAALHIHLTTLLSSILMESLHLHLPPNFPNLLPLSNEIILHIDFIDSLDSISWKQWFSLFHLIRKNLVDYYSPSLHPHLLLLVLLFHELWFLFWILLFFFSFLGIYIYMVG